MIVLLNSLGLQLYDPIYRQIYREIGFSYMLKGSKTDRLRAGPPLPPRKIPGTHFW
jgi:hypothetical protein